MKIRRLRADQGNGVVMVGNPFVNVIQVRACAEAEKRAGRGHPRPAHASGYGYVACGAPATAPATASNAVFTPNWRASRRVKVLLAALSPHASTMSSANSRRCIGGAHRPWRSGGGGRESPRLSARLLPA